MSRPARRRCRIYGASFSHGFVLRHVRDDVDRFQVTGAWYVRTGDLSAIDEPTFIPEKRRWLRAYGVHRPVAASRQTYLEAHPNRATIGEARWDTYWSGRVWWKCDHCGIRSDASSPHVAALTARLHNVNRHPRRARRMMLEARGDLFVKAAP